MAFNTPRTGTLPRAENYGSECGGSGAGEWAHSGTREARAPSGETRQTSSSELQGPRPNFWDGDVFNFPVPNVSDQVN